MEGDALRSLLQLAHCCFRKSLDGPLGGQAHEFAVCADVLQTKRLEERCQSIEVCRIVGRGCRTQEQRAESGPITVAPVSHPTEQLEHIFGHLLDSLSKLLWCGIEECFRVLWKDQRQRHQVTRRIAALEQ